MATLPEAIAAAVSTAYARAPRGAAPQSQREWTVLAAVLLTPAPADSYDKTATLMSHAATAAATATVTAAVTTQAVQHPAHNCPLAVVRDGRAVAEPRSVQERPPQPDAAHEPDLAAEDSLPPCLVEREAQQGAGECALIAAEQPVPENLAAPAAMHDAAASSTHAHHVKNAPPHPPPADARNSDAAAADTPPPHVAAVRGGEPQPARASAYGTPVVVALATGTKCLGAEPLAAADAGTLVHDAHAEVLARRCFQR